jgi:hypothetical protein
MDACAELVKLADSLAEKSPTPRDFLFDLGVRAGGVRRGPVGYLDLLRGGRNVFPGDGIKEKFDDDTGGQIRHFAGIVAASVRVGPARAEWLSENVGNDARRSPDGRLTHIATKFSRLVLSGELAVSDAPGWLSTHVCA